MWSLINFNFYNNYLKYVWNQYQYHSPIHIGSVTFEQVCSPFRPCNNCRFSRNSRHASNSKKSSLSIFFFSPLNYRPNCTTSYNWTLGWLGFSRSASFPICNKVLNCSLISLYSNHFWPRSFCVWIWVWANRDSIKFLVSSQELDLENSRHPTAQRDLVI